MPPPYTGVGTGPSLTPNRVHASAVPRVVDLSQPLGPATTLWPGSTPVETPVASTIERDGSYSRDLRTPEHAGTHLDAPAHFAPDGVVVDGIPVERLVVPAAVVDVRD